MLKDRKEGLAHLHGCALTLTSVAAYGLWLAFCRYTGWIQLAQGVDLSLYLLGVLVASFWIHHNLATVSLRLGDMGLIESIRAVKYQLLRLVAVLFTLAFVTKDSEVSRAFLLGYVLVMAPVYTMANICWPKLIIRLLFRGMSMRVVIAARADEARRLHRMMAERAHLGLEVVGWIGDGLLEGEKALPKLGELSELRHVIAEYDVSQVVISQQSFPPEEARAIGQCAEEAGCRVRFFAHVQLYFPDRPVTIEHDGEFTFASLTHEPLDNPANRLLKRLLDIAISLPVVLFVLPPLALVVWIMQQVQSPGPVMHRQYRSGLNRKKFLIYKFRTMHLSHEATSLTKQAQRNDSRIYPFGAFMRRTSLDEFPQFLNVLRGEMSVSGPRPHLLEHDEQFAKVVHTYYTRHFVKPGITGLAQSQGYRGEISEPSLLRKRIGYDMVYVRRWSFALDLQILLQTARQIVFPPRSAY